MTSGPATASSAGGKRCRSNGATGLEYPLPPIRRALDRHKPIGFAAL